jgi:purine nucleosidase
MAFQEWESGLSGGYMHDPLAVAAVIAPDMVETADVSIDVLADGTDRGRSIARPAEPGRTVRAVRSVDADRFLALLETRVLAPIFSL